MPLRIWDPTEITCATHPRFELYIFLFVFSFYHLEHIQTAKIYLTLLAEPCQVRDWRDSSSIEWGRSIGSRLVDRRQHSPHRRIRRKLWVKFRLFASKILTSAWRAVSKRGLLRGFDCEGNNNAHIIIYVFSKMNCLLLSWCPWAECILWTSWATKFEANSN